MLLPLLCTEVSVFLLVFLLEELTLPEGCEFVLAGCDLTAEDEPLFDLLGDTLAGALCVAALFRSDDGALTLRAGAVLVSLRGAGLFCKAGPILSTLLVTLLFWLPGASGAGLAVDAGLAALLCTACPLLSLLVFTVPSCLRLVSVLCLAALLLVRAGLVAAEFLAAFSCLATLALLSEAACEVCLPDLEFTAASRGTVLPEPCLWV